MKIKFENGGIIKLQKAGSVPTSQQYGINMSGNDMVQDAFDRSQQQWEWNNILKEAEKRASERMAQENKSMKGVLNNMRFADETGELRQGMNTNAKYAQYVAEELGLDGNQAFIDSYIQDGTLGLSMLGKAGLYGLMASIPVANIANYGLLGGAFKTAGQFVGSDLLGWGGRKVGRALDNKFNTNFLEEGLGTVGEFTGWVPGGKAGYNLSKNILRRQMRNRLLKGKFNIPNWWASSRMKGDVLRDAQNRYMWKYAKPTPEQRQLSYETVDDQGYGLAYKKGGILKGQGGIGKAGKALVKVAKRIPGYGKMTELEKKAMEQAFNDMRSAKMPIYDEASVLRLPKRESLYNPSTTSGITDRGGRVLGRTTRGTMGRADLMEPDYGHIGTMPTAKQWADYRIQQLQTRRSIAEQHLSYPQFLTDWEKRYYQSQIDQIQKILDDDVYRIGKKR